METNFIIIDEESSNMNGKEEEVVIEEPSTQPEWKSMTQVRKDLQAKLATYLTGAEVDKITSGGWQTGVYRPSHGETRAESFYVGTQIENNSKICRSVLLYGKKTTEILEHTAVYWGKTAPHLSHVLYFYQKLYKRKQDPEPVKPSEGLEKPPAPELPYKKKTEAEKAQGEKAKRDKIYHQGPKL